MLSLQPLRQSTVRMRDAASNIPYPQIFLKNFKFTLEVL